MKNSTQQSPVDILFYGNEAPLAPPIQLTAGKLKMLYEAGNLRYIRLGDTEILRMIYAAVRDQNWGNVPQRIENEEIRTDINSFKISYDAWFVQGEIQFKAHFAIVGSADSTLVFSLYGQALTSFKKNRIGFCILHPISECAGKNLTIIEPEGDLRETVFPYYISPHQPAINIAAMHWQPNDNTTCKLAFTGDIFEMEDQRNWSDASYKTYSTPLSIPFPAIINAGDTVNQKISLSVETNQSIQETNDRKLSVSISNKRKPLPQIGICASTEVKALDETQIYLLQQLNLSHYRIDVHFSSGDWITKFKQNVLESQQLNLSLEIALHFTTSYLVEAKQLIDVIEHIELKITRILLFDATSHLTNKLDIHAINKVLLKKFLNTQKAGGADAYFTELNRNRIPTLGFDLVSFSICPQVHAIDNKTLVENIRGQKYIVESANHYFPDCGVAVSPITFKQRFNVVATSKEKPASTSGLPPQVDVRQMSLFGAGWTLGSIKYLAESGVESISYFETVGAKGIIQQQTPVYADFPAQASAIYPVYFLLKAIMEFCHGEVIESESSVPLQFECLVLKNDTNQRLLLTNYTDVTLSIELPVEYTNNAMLTLLSAQEICDLQTDQNLDTMKQKPQSNWVELPPFALAIIDN